MVDEVVVYGEVEAPAYRVAVRDDERIWTIGLPSPGHYLVELPPSVARPGTPPKVTRLEPPAGEGDEPVPPVTHLP